jgi:peptide-methionine (S)-S-oxide reductase
MTASFFPARLIVSVLLSLGVLALAACATNASGDKSTEVSAPTNTTDAPPVDPAVLDTATFAGGCFWCMEPPYDKIEGVQSTISGYAGGEQPNPTYDEVAGGRTNHTESVQVVYDTTAVGFERLLEVYWHNVDPLDDRGQFCDRGRQYRPVIFYHDARQQRLAEASKQELVASNRFDQPIVVPVQPLDAFYPAEEYHQNFYQKNPTRYTTYRRGCGRDARLQELWGDEAGS